MTEGKRLSVGIVIFPDVEELDFVGPWEVFTMARSAGAPLDVFTVGWPVAEVTCAKGLKVIADHPFSSAPHADIVLIPGGKGTRPLAQDEVFNTTIRSYLAAATWQTSVCTGSALLARAGFLEGRRATTNSSALDFLRAHAPHTYILDERYVHDGSVITSAGVSAGIDMSLWLVGHLFGEDTARTTQSYMEYFSRASLRKSVSMTYQNDITITPQLVADHGLKTDEFDKIVELIGRQPTYTELGIFSAMWNEHCSYKSSKKWLKTLPTTGPYVIQGPGENAGVVDIGDGQAIVFKMESHNHPSFIEPYQGAATGVGGILRDVFTMGARPVAAMNALRFGAPDHEKTRHLVSGVVAGVGGYGNAFGVPTVGGEVEFDERYNGNILVNAFAAGLADTDKIFYSKAEGVGLPVVYLGAKTGRDGVGGATMASAEFGDDIEEKRPTVQVGDPFTEKRLLEACLELMATGAVIAIQDMGAAGLTCSAVEMGAKGDLGIELDLDKVPVRETHMTPYEMMLSESQERMLMVLHPEKEAEARAVFEKWELDFATVGKTTDDLRFRVMWQGQEVANLPIKELGDEAPEYDRPWTPSIPAPALAADDIPQMDVADALLQLMGSHQIASRRWVFEQYDTLIQGNSMQRPGGDAGVIRVEGHPTKGLAFTSDVTPRYCEADPYEGGKQAVAEAWRNLTATGAQPLAATDNLNFGNPERPEIMSQLVHAIKGIGEACRALDFPIVSGNVSLYNETNGRGILPTPTIGGVGLLPDWTKMARIGFAAENQMILLVGAPPKRGTHLGQSVYLRDLFGRRDGSAPPVDLAHERRTGDFVRKLIRDGVATSVHDLSDGGLAVGLAEMAIASGIGAKIVDLNGQDPILQYFGEDQGRYIVTVNLDPQGEAIAQLWSQADQSDVFAPWIGTTGGSDLVLGTARPVAVHELKAAHEGWFPKFMDGVLA